jgi:hypothetical protein
MKRAGIFMMPGCTAVRTITCRASCAGLPPISASTTYIIYAAGSLITGCSRCYGITPSLLPLDGLHYFRAFDVCPRSYGMRGGVSSFLFGKWKPLTCRFHGNWSKIHSISSLIDRMMMSIPSTDEQIVGPVPREISVGTAALGTAETSLAKDYGLAGNADLTSSVITLKPARVHGPNEVTIATSVASRPRAIRMRPMRGWLWRASNVYQRSPR